jgi:PAS domain S-box-containing protein
MEKHSEETPDWEAQRNRIIGLGETSIRKSYYPELQQRIQELERKNRELQAAFAEQTAVEEELRQQIDETGKKERELRVNEERLVMAQNIGHSGGWEYSFESNKIWASSEALRIYGFPPVPGYYSLVDIEARVEERERIQQAFVDFINGRRKYDIEITVNPLDGSSQRIVRSIALLEKDAQDRPLRVVGVLQDITERKAAERALKASEERFRNLIEASPIPIVLVREGMFIYTNSAFCHVTGYDRPDDVMGKPLLDFVSPEFRALVAGYIQKRSRGEPADLHYESLGLRRDGSRFPYEITVAVINLSDGPATMAFISDITERKQAEENLRESEKKYRTLFDNSSDAILIHDLTGRILDSNQVLCERLGYSREELLLMTPMDFDSPEYAEQVPERIRQLMMKKHLIFETCNVRKDGTRIPTEVNARIIDYNGEQVCLIVGRDITERKRAEDALRESEKKYRDIVETTPDLIWDIDTQGNFTYLSPQVFDMFGYRAEDLMGKPFFVLVPPDQIPSVTRAFEQQVLKGPSLVTLEVIAHHADGHRMDIEIRSANATDEQGRLVGFRGITRDITESKSAQDALVTSEERYRSLVDITDTGYLVLDKRGLILDANDVYLRLTGRSSLAELIGHSVTEWTAPYDLERNAREVENCLTTGQVRGLEIDYVKPDGTIQPIEINAAVFHAGSRDVILTVCRDISDRKRTNVALQQARNKLNLLNAVTFQDIQTAAFSLSAYQELVKTVITDAKAKSYLHKQELFLKKMVDTLDFARNFQEMGIHPPRWQNIRQVFLYAISHLDFLHIKQNLQLDDLEIFADPLFEKSLFNIMENVLSHGVHATEVTLRYEEKSDHLTLIIEDNGVGIFPEEKNMIFDRGYGKGSGLGLFLVREVLSITGMTIRETGTQGKGTRFEITVFKGTYRFTGR